MSAGHGHDPAICRDLLEKLSEFVDGELDEASCAELEAHLAECEPCVRFLRSLRRTVGHLSRIPRLEMPEEIRRACLEAYARRRRGA